MPAPSVETKILMAIRAHVDTLPMKATYPVIWSDGEGYTPNPTQPYLRCTWTPNTTQRLFIGSDDPHRRPGVLQIDVFERLAQGSIVAREVAGQVAAHFAADTKMVFQGVTVQVIKAPSVRGVFIDTHVQVPIEIEVEALA